MALRLRHLRHGQVVIANRIFETRIYNFFLSEELLDDKSYKAASEIKDQFLQNGRLDMDVVIDYLGQQYVVEMKIWRGEEYNRRG